MDKGLKYWHVGRLQEGYSRSNRNGTKRFVDVPTLSHPLESVLSSSGVPLGVSGVADRIGEKRKER